CRDFAHNLFPAITQRSSPMRNFSGVVVVPRFGVSVTQKSQITNVSGCKHEPPSGDHTSKRGDSDMKKLLLVGTAWTVLLGGSALAADLRTPPPPPPPVYSWTGFYIGGNLGGAWARGSVDDSLFG